MGSQKEKNTYVYFGSGKSLRTTLMSLGHVDKYYFTKYLVCQYWVLFFRVTDKSKRSITKRKSKPLLSHLPQLINTIITLT
jgi:hypothetical protein